MLRNLCLILIGCSLPVYVFAVDRFIVKYKPTTIQQSALLAGGSKAMAVRLDMAKPLNQNKISILASFADGANIREINQVANGAHVIVLDRDLDKTQAINFINNVQNQANVEYIEEDRLLQPISTTGDVIQVNPLWQWDMGSRGEYISQPGWNGNDFKDAWLVLKAAGYGIGKDVVIAVVDTGYTPHPNILNAMQPGVTPGTYGYQLISDCRISGQCPPSTPTDLARSSYQADAADLGDYVSLSDISDSDGFFDPSCLRNNSTWHGTHVTGTLVANGYTSANPTYIAGGAYDAHVLPVRVLGKCGGYVSDIANGVLWAAGLPVVNNGVQIPNNPNPAQVINMSLGAAGACDKTEQDTIDAVNKTGSVIVVAAGNGSSNIKDYNPSGCSGLIVVAAKGPTDKLAYYSNYGATTITAAGGDSSVSGCYQDIDGRYNCPSQVYSTVWSSPQAFQSSSNGGYPSFAFYSGTSMATPHVAAAVANMISILKVKKETYSLYGIISVLQQTANSYDNCNASGCTASGDLNTESAIKYVIRNDALPTTSVQQASPAVAASGGGGGGGCSAIIDGDDYSLILLLFGSVLYACKRKKFKLNRGRMVE